MSEEDSSVSILKTGLIFLLFGTVIVVTIYTATKDTGIIEDDNSKNRLNTLNEALTSYFGRAWAYVLLFILMLLMLLTFYIYKKINTDTIININEHTGSILIKIFVIFLIMFTIIIIIVALNSYLSSKAEDDGVGISNYIPAEDIKAKKKQILTIVGASLVLLFILGLLFHYFWTKYKKEDPNI